MSAHAVYGALTLGASLVLLVLGVWIVGVTLTRRRRAAWRKFHQAERESREKWLTGMRYAVVRRWSPDHVRLMWYVAERVWVGWPVSPIRQLLADPPHPSEYGFGQWKVVSGAHKSRDTARRTMRNLRGRLEHQRRALAHFTEGFASA